MPVTLTATSSRDASILQNLMQLYAHDFSEFWAGTPQGDLSPEGLFEAYPLDDYWRRPAWSASMIWSDGVLAGFVLVNDRSHLGEPVDRNMAEFFVLRKHRGRGVGRVAAEMAFSAHPGSWEVAIARKNLPAGAFWRGVVNGSARASGVREIDASGDRWNGPILRFDWSAG